METLNNEKLIVEIVKILVNVKEKIEKTTNEFNYYLEHLKYEKLEEIPNETEDEALKKAESIFNRLEEIVQRKKLVLKNGKETIELIDNVRNKIEIIVKSGENDEIQLAKTNNELIDKIIELEERKMNKEIEILQNKIGDVKQRFFNKKYDWDNQRLNNKELSVKEKEELKSVNKIVGFREIEKLEEWTGMKVGNIIFDSDVDNWNINTSVFDQKILNKSNLLFLIEEDGGNIFGGYVNTIIDKILPKDSSFNINDPNSFVFSLKPNGKINGMMKFDNIDPQNAFYLRDRFDDFYLFDFGGCGDIWVKKENQKKECFCKQNSFNYRGIENALCGKESFTPTRITVIQMV